jgi:hypothetical protein
MRPERDEDGRQTRCRRALMKMTKDVAVTEVDTVECPDGDH